MSKRGVWIAGGFVGVVALGSVAACSGTGSPNVSGVTATESSYCEQRAARSRNCAPDTGVVFDAGTSTGTSSACAEDFRCVVAIFAYPDAYLSCRSNPDCSASTGDNACAEKAAQGGSTADRDACLAKRTSCKDSGAKTFDDDTCALLPALKASVARDIMACVQQGCDVIAGCIKNVGEQIPGCD
jgi:hypothetical protein